MHPTIVHGLVTGGLFGFASALGTAEPSLAVTFTSNLLYGAGILTALVSLLALLADHLALRETVGTRPGRRERTFNG